jgi:hypothetical protein
VIVQVAGMKANTTYHMRARIDYDNGTSETDIDRTFTTGSIPSGILPPFTVTATSGLTPQPGVEMVNTLQGNAGISTAFATDVAGNVVWYYPFSDYAPGLSLYPVKQLPNGHFMCEIADISSAPILPAIPAGALNEFREFDLVGNTIRSLTMSDLNARLAAAGFNITLQLFSHDFLALPNGHFLVLTNTLRSFTNLVGFPGVTNVLGDVVVDLDPEFNPVWVWSEFDHFDVNRHPMGFPDWTHSNALAYSADDGNFLISIRHQNWIAKVDYRDGAGTGNVHGNSEKAATSHSRAESIQPIGSMPSMMSTSSVQIRPEASSLRLWTMEMTASHRPPLRATAHLPASIRLSPLCRWTKTPKRHHFSSIRFCRRTYIPALLGAPGYCRIPISSTTWQASPTLSPKPTR